MGKNKVLVRELCASYCAYYKPGKNEELLCRGAVVVQRLWDEKKLVPGRHPPQASDNSGQQEELILHLCSACDFRQDDCDFAQNHAARPCGGFVLLRGLIEAGIIDLADVR